MYKNVTLFPAVAGESGATVLFTPLFNSQTALGLFFAKDSHWLSLICYNFLVVFMRIS